MTPEQIYSHLDFSWKRKTPVILQAEASECGLSCIAMIAAHHGRRLDLARVRQIAGSSSRGTTLTRMMHAASKLGMQARPLRLDLEEMDRLSLPCILHWEMNHFVVLIRAGKEKIQIIDPAIGRRTLSITEASGKFTGIAMELLPGPTFIKIHEQSHFSLRQLFRNASGLLPSLVRIFGLAIVLELLGILSPLLTQLVTDQVLPFGDTELLTLLAIGFSFLIVIQVGVGALRSWTIACMSSNLNLAWTTNLFSYLLRLPESYFQERNLGDVMSRFGALGNIQGALTTSLIEAILDGIVALFTVALLFFYSPLLATVTLAAFFAYVAVRVLMFSLFREAQHEQIIASASQNSLLMESLRGVRTVKLLNGTRMMTSRYANRAAETINRSFVTQRLALIFGAASTFIFGIHKIVVLWLGAKAVINAEITIGMLMAAAAYAAQFTARGGKLIDYAIELRMLRLYVDRLSDIVLTEPESNTEAKHNEYAIGTDISIENISFRYSENDPWVLKDVSLHAKEGESIALVGPSGCGKTTLAKVILGLLEPSNGCVRFGGCRIEDIGKEKFRDVVGTVMQDDQLFAGSLADNISFFDDERNYSSIESAAVRAQIHDEIMSMPMRYETFVGDMGSALSGGQKQRVLLARALYRNPKVLVLDEATSHLDVANESRVNEAIRNEKMTRIIVAHRPETISSADRVVFLVNGAAFEQSQEMLAEVG